jgi:DNA-binding NarL/FixJ family response regulator
VIQVFDRGESQHADGPTVLLADDQVSERTGIRYALEHAGFSVVAEAVDASGAVAAALEHRPQVCLLDVDMPGGGVEAADRIVAQLPATKIAMLSGSKSEQALVAAIRAGADGFLLRSTPPDRVSVALTALLHGEATLPRSLTGLLVTELRRPPDSDRLELPVNGRKVQQRSSIRYRMLYAPRFLRHFARRTSGMTLRQAWMSARHRMAGYR